MAIWSFLRSGGIVITTVLVLQPSVLPAQDTLPQAPSPQQRLEVQSCYEILLYAVHKRAKGRLALSVLVKTDGTVATVRFEEDTLNYPHLKEGDSAV